MPTRCVKQALPSSRSTTEALPRRLPLSASRWILLPRYRLTGCFMARPRRSPNECAGSRNISPSGACSTRPSARRAMRASAKATASTARPLRLPQATNAASRMRFSTASSCAHCWSDSSCSSPWKNTVSTKSPGRGRIENRSAVRSTGLLSRKSDRWLRKDEGRDERDDERNCKNAARPVTVNRLVRVGVGTLALRDPMAAPRQINPNDAGEDDQRRNDPTQRMMHDRFSAPVWRSGPALDSTHRHRVVSPCAPRGMLGVPRSPRASWPPPSKRARAPAQCPYSSTTHPHRAP